MSEIRPRKAAEHLGVTRRTVQRWCKAATKGKPEKLTRVRKNGVGEYWIDENEVRGIKVLKSF